MAKERQIIEIPEYPTVRELATLMGTYNQSLFEIQNPRVRIEYIAFDMWSQNFRSALAVALAGNRAPAYYIARDLPQTIDQGMYADLTVK